MSLAIGNNAFINNVEVDNPERKVKNAKVAGFRRGLAKGLHKVADIIEPENIGAKVSSCFRNTFAFLAYSVEHSERVQSVVKFGKSAVPFVKYVFKAETQGFNNLANDLDKVDSILDLVDFVNDVKDWFVPKVDPLAPKDDQGQVVATMFWNHKGFTKWKLVSKIIGTASKVLGVVKFTLDIGLLKLGQLSAAMNSVPFLSVVLKFSPLRVVKDSFSIISAGFGIVHESIRIHQKTRDANILDYKIGKWEAKDELRKYLQLDEEAKQAVLNQKVQQQVPLEQKEQLYLQQVEVRYMNARQALEHLNVQPRPGRENEPAREDMNPEQKWNHIKIQYANPEMQALNQVKCENKIKDKTVDFNNNAISRRKHAFTIAFNVAKIGAMIIGLVGIFAAAIAGNIAFIVALSTAWFITSVIGMGKLYYGYRHQNVH